MTRYDEYYEFQMGKKVSLTSKDTAQRIDSIYS